MDKLDQIQTEINDAQDQYDSAVDAYNTAVKKMDEAQTKIEEAQKRIDENQEKLSKRAVAIYRSGTPSMVDVLLGSSSFEDFVKTSTMVNSLNEYDAELVAESKDAKAEAQAAKDEYASQKSSAEEQMKIAEEAKKELQTKASEMKSQISQLTAEAEELEAQEEAAAAEANQQSYQGNQGSAIDYGGQGESVVTGSGEFTHPCPGYSSISSTFGYRSFDNSFHKGVDFAASQGTPVYAAASGTVLIAGYSSTAGNWVVISHGNGLVTKYMHMATTPYVHAGQTVSKGTNIGVVGSTGNSTGPHLHFQVEVNGTAVNPMLYL
ncbi:MAG: murein hydrolase activator EnvC family protein [Coriobacteriales bacterium]